MWRALIDAQRAGRIRVIGVSNYDQQQIAQLESATGVRPALNEIEFHPWVPLSTFALVDWCQRRDIGIIAYGSLGSKSTDKTRLKGQISELAVSVNASSAQLLLRWALDRGIAVIPGATSAGHIRDNLLAGSFTLSADQRAQLRQLQSSVKQPRGFRRWLNLGRTPQTAT